MQVGGGGAGDGGAVLGRVRGRGDLGALPLEQSRVRRFCSRLFAAITTFSDL